MFPYMDLLGYQRRTSIPDEWIESVEGRSQGFIAQMISSWSSYANARLRKRYDNNYKSVTNLPLGQKPPAILATGLNPPVVTLTGRPTLGSMVIKMSVTGGGALGTAALTWSYDGGLTPAGTVTTGASVPLVSSAGFYTGLTANFSAGTYDTSNVYVSDTPVPEAVLRWLVAVINPDVIAKHSPGHNDPDRKAFEDAKTLALAELKEVADGNVGLWDLPMSEDEGSAISTGGPRATSQQSPYEWTDQQAAALGSFRIRPGIIF